MPRKLAKEKFIEKAILRHGDSYDYTNVIYVNSVTKINIIHKKCNQSLDQIPNYHLNNVGGCPFCSNKKVYIKNCLSTTNPEVCIFWHPTKNKMTCSDLTSSFNKKVWWLCENNHEYEDFPLSQIRVKNKCKVCNSLAVKFPELINLWDKQKNTTSPDQVSKLSSKKYWWVCAFGHSWQENLPRITMRSKEKCRTCSSLYIKYPEVAIEWNYQKNNISPDAIYFNSLKKCWWKCRKCNSEYRRAPAFQIKNEKNCFNCNSLVYKYPNIAKEWNDSKNNINANDVSFGSKLKVWWRCKNNHEWEARVEDRTINKSGCARCSGYKKKTNEEYILQATKVHGINYNYSKLNYINANTNILIICNTCKTEFFQFPNHHLHGHGCWSCSKTSSEHGFYFSIKMGIDIKYDSSWEKAKMKLYDKDSDILSWNRCIDKIKYIDPETSKIRTYNPDFEILYNDGQIVIEEIKGLIDDNAKSKFFAAQDFYKQINKSYKMITKQSNNFIEVNFDSEGTLL